MFLAFKSSLKWLEVTACLPCLFTCEGWHDPAIFPNAQVLSEFYVRFTLHSVCKHGGSYACFTLACVCLGWGFFFGSMLREDNAFFVMLVPATQCSIVFIRGSFLHKLLVCIWREVIQWETVVLGAAEGPYQWLEKALVRTLFALVFYMRNGTTKTAKVRVILVKPAFLCSLLVLHRQ